MAAAMSARKARWVAKRNAARAAAAERPPPTAKEMGLIAFARPLILEYCLGSVETKAALHQALSTAKSTLAPLEYVLEKSPNAVIRETQDQLTYVERALKLKTRHIKGPSPKRTRLFRLAGLIARAIGTAILPPTGFNEYGSWCIIWPHIRAQDAPEFARDFGAFSEEKTLFDLHGEHWYADEEFCGQRRDFVTVHRELLARFREHRGRATWLCPPSSRPSSSPAS